MKSLFTLLLLLPLLLPAQDCAPLIARAEQDIAARRYQEAINKLLLLQEECPADREQVAALIQQTFTLIQGERNRADSALAVAERVLDQMYFYEGKFGLTLKNVGRDYRPEYRYGFIDREGREVIPFEFEEATPFSTRDGFARVSRGGKKYLLDTTGRTYLLAESLAELTPQSEALDLHKQRPDSLPDLLGDYPKLKVILAYGDFGNKGKLSQLPPSLASLRELVVLDLRDNQLLELPQNFSQLQNLQTLDLGRNQLSELPQNFPQLQNLQALDLFVNQLSELPQNFAQLQNLQSLDLSSNQLSELSQNFAQLQNLQVLDISFNRLSVLPQNFAQLQNLKSLDLNRNQLSVLPQNFVQLQNLQRLNLYRNQLSELSQNFAQLQNLQELDLGGNELTELPQNFAQLQNLQKLDLRENQLSELPPSICQIKLYGQIELYRSPSYLFVPPTGVAVLSGNPFTHLPDCFLDKFTQRDLLDWTAEFLNDSLYPTFPTPEALPAVSYLKAACLYRRTPFGMPDRAERGGTGDQHP